jgi:hypothetical protein
MGTPRPKQYARPLPAGRILHRFAVFIACYARFAHPLLLKRLDREPPPAEFPIFYPLSAIYCLLLTAYCLPTPPAAAFAPF